MSAPDRRLLPVVLGGVLLLVAIGLLGIRPRLDRAGELDTRIEAQARREAGLRADIARLLVDREHLPANRRALRRLAVALPPTARAAGLLRELDALARRHDVRLRATEVTSAATQPTLPPGAQPTAQRPPGIPMRITLDGRYPDVRRLLAALDRQVRARGSRLVVHGRLLTVDGVSTAIAKDGGLETTLAATAHVAPETPGGGAATAAAADAPRSAGGGGDPFGSGKAPAAAVASTPAAVRAARAAAAPAAAAARRSAAAVRATTTALARAATTPAAVAKPASGRTRRWIVDAVDLRASRAGRVAHARRDVPRLSLLPSARRPSAMFAGLLKDRRTVALLVGAGAKVRGGRCRPTRTACTMLMLKPGRRARITDPRNGTVTVRVVRVRHATVTDPAAARAARRRESPAGRCLLTSLGLVDGAFSARQGTLRWSRPPEDCTR